MGVLLAPIKFEKKIILGLAIMETNAKEGRKKLINCDEGNNFNFFFGSAEDFGHINASLFLLV